MCIFTERFAYLQEGLPVGQEIYLLQEDLSIPQQVDLPIDPEIWPRICITLIFNLVVRRNGASGFRLVRLLLRRTNLLYSALISARTLH
jgi:hypothetical protein